MKKFMFMLAFVVFTSVNVFAGTERLIGTWKSNREATVAYLKTHTKLTPQQLDRLATVFGKMTITFDAKNVTFKSGDWHFTSIYRVISETKDSITIESEDPGTKKPTQGKLEFDGNGFWCPDDKILGFKEKFDKVAQK